jgi:adenylate cyclase
VLPFRNLTGTPGDEYFAAGITEAIGTELAKARGLSVISGSSVTPYRGQAVDPQKAGRGLGVTHLLDGSVQRTGNHVRVNARLTEVSTGRQVWADRYDREDKDVFALQDDIARNVGTALRVSLRGRSGSDPPTSSLAAYDAYLRGRFHYRNFYDVRESKSAAEGLAAVARFQEAVALDPRFAQAHAALGETYASLFFYLGPRKEAEEQAYVAIERALSLDPDLPEAYAARGLLAWTLAHGFPHERAAADFRHALELNPNLVDARWMLGRLYMHVGLLDAARSQLEIARRLAPDELRSVNRIGLVYLFQGRYEDALAAFAQMPADRLDDETVRPLLYLGRTEEASRVAQACVRKSPDEPSFHASYALVLAREGDVARAEQEVERAIQGDRGSSHYHHAEYDIGSAYALAGRKAAAVEWLERAAAHGMPSYPVFRDDPFLASLKGDRAFDTLLARLKTQWEGYQRDLLPPPP